MDENLLLPDPRKPGRADAIQNRRLLLETARMLFATYGVSEVSMAAIAQAANVGKGTLYRHFENKSELCQALLDQEQRELQERTLERLRHVEDPVDNLRWFILQVAAFVQEHSEMLCVEVGSEGFGSLEHPAHLWWRQTIRQLLAQLSPPGDIDYMADVLYVMLDVHTLYFQQTRLGYDMQQINDGLLQILLKFLN